MPSEAYTRRQEAMEVLNKAKAQGDIIRRGEEAKADQVYRDEVDALVVRMKEDNLSNFQVKVELQNIFNRRTNRWNQAQWKYYESYWPELIEYSEADKAYTNYLAQERIPQPNYPFQGIDKLR